MKTQNSGPVELSLRFATLAYIFLLVVLPITAITVEAFQKGPLYLWEQISSPQVMHALKITLGAALVMVIINVVTGTAVAWALVRYRFPLKNLIDGLVDIPFAIPTVVTGVMLVVLYGPKSTIGALLGKMGIEVIYDKPGIVLALLFVTFPFVVRAVQPVLMEMDRDMEEAARTLGATRFYTFRRVVIPTLRPAVLTGAALSFSRALGEFGSIVIVAGNIPFKTQVLSVYIYGEIESANVPGALGAGIILLAASLVVLGMLNYLQNNKKMTANR